MEKLGRLGTGPLQLNPCPPTVRKSTASVTAPLREGRLGVLKANACKSGSTGYSGGETEKIRLPGSGGLEQERGPQCPPRASPQALTERVLQVLRDPRPWSLQSPSAKPRNSLSHARAPTDTFAQTHTHSFKHRPTHVCSGTLTDTHTSGHGFQGRTGPRGTPFDGAGG